jgi:hypothetical protein
MDLPDRAQRYGYNRPRVGKASGADLQQVFARAQVLKAEFA